LNFLDCKRCAAGIGLAALAIAAFMGCGGAGTAASPGPVLTGNVATIDSLLSAQSGRWVLVNVWATWCRPCVAETPDLVAFAHEMKERPLSMVAVSTDYFTVDDTTAVRKVTEFQLKQDIPYANLVFMGTVDELTERLDLDGPLPTTILFGPDGQSQKQFIGRLEDDDLRWIASQVGGA
jgi:thiol-disulfide isomerase/thioredoxin